MTSEDIRRENARKLSIEVGGQAEFGRRVSMSDSQVTQILGEKKTKNIGSLIARRIEKAFDKPHGWLDVYHPAEPNVMVEVSPDEIRVIEIYRSSPTGRLLIEGAINTSFSLPDAAAAAGGTQ
jgi:hypothetical protein